jgi:ATP-binding cassette, subfamily C (CFTR/MRP), member 1
MRLAIARSIYQDNQTIILDDPISALDNEVSNHIIN